MSRTTYIQAAYQSLCKDAKHPERVWVSLYQSVPFYGGPEEGGWWGRDSELLESQMFTDRATAEQVRDKVQEAAEDMKKAAKRSYGDQCRRECDWLEARGLDDDFLPEPDGPTDYFVVVEDQHGSREAKESRHYE